MMLFALMVVMSYIGRSAIPATAAAAVVQGAFSKRLASVGVIGGGFAGLAIANELSHLTDELHIYDVCAPGNAGASSAAGGLLHPFAPRGNFVWNGREGFRATVNVLGEIKLAGLNAKGMINEGNNPIYRPIFSEGDLQTWRQSMHKHPDVLDEISADSYVQTIHPNHNIKPLSSSESSQKALVGCMVLKESAIIHAPLYLRQLWKLVQSKCRHSRWHNTLCDSQVLYSELAQKHEVVIIAGGYASMLFFQQQKEEIRSNTHSNNRLSSVKFVRGRNLHYRYNQNHDHASHLVRNAVLSGEYIVPRFLQYPICTDQSNNALSDDHSYSELVAGATHEHMPILDEGAIKESLLQDSKQSVNQVTSDDVSSIEAAQLLLEEKLSHLNPELSSASSDYELYGVSSGIRLVTERSNLGRLPIVGKYPCQNDKNKSDNIWMLTGLGSRGLVYHALMASYLRQAICANDEKEHIPSVLHPQQLLKTRN